jgi:hypothetical protein
LRAERSKARGTAPSPIPPAAITGTGRRHRRRRHERERPYLTHTAAGFHLRNDDVDAGVGRFASSAEPIV